MNTTANHTCELRLWLSFLAKAHFGPTARRFFLALYAVCLFATPGQTLAGAAAAPRGGTGVSPGRIFDGSADGG